MAHLVESPIRPLGCLFILPLLLGMIGCQPASNCESSPEGCAAESDETSDESDSTSTESSTDGDESSSETGAGDGDGDAPGDGDGDAPGDGDGDAPGDGDGDSPGDSDEPPECDEGQILCGDICVDSLEDPENCGECDNACDVGSWCEEGMCTKERVMFVTSEAFTGNLGGIAGADAICQSFADSAELEGEFRAWIGDGEVGPSSTFTKLGYFVRTDGLIIADSWEDLVDGALVAPISIDENGNVAEHEVGLGCEQPGRAVWTAVDVTGQPVPGHCEGWTNDAPGVTLGKVGYLDHADASWTAAPPVCSVVCAASLPLYCVQQ